MAWCPEAARHYLNQCWQSSLTPYGIIKPQCVDGTVYPITMMPHEYCCILNCWQLNSLFNILFRLTVKKITKPHITGPVIQWITLTHGASNMEYTSMLWCHSGRKCIFELCTWTLQFIFCWPISMAVHLTCSHCMFYLFSYHKSESVSMTDHDNKWLMIQFHRSLGNLAIMSLSQVVLAFFILRGWWGLTEMHFMFKWSLWQYVLIMVSCVDLNMDMRDKVIIGLQKNKKSIKG